MSFILSSIFGVVAKAVGGHLVEGFLLRSLTGTTGTLLALVGGLGWRFAAGLLAALYFQNEGVRHAINAVLGAVKTAVLG